MKHSIKLLAFALYICLLPAHLYCRMNVRDIQLQLQAMKQKKNWTDADFAQWQNLINQYTQVAGAQSSRTDQQYLDLVKKVTREVNEALAEQQEQTATPQAPATPTPEIKPTEQPKKEPAQETKPIEQPKTELPKLEELVAIAPNVSHVTERQKTTALAQLETLQKQIEAIIFGSERKAQKLLTAVNAVIDNFKKNLQPILQRDMNMLVSQYQKYSARAQQLLAQQQEQQAQETVLSLLVALDKQVTEVKYALEFLTKAQPIPTKPTPETQPQAEQPKEQPKPKPAEQKTSPQKTHPTTNPAPTTEKQPTIVPIYNLPTAQELAQQQLKPTSGPAIKKDPIATIKDAQKILDGAQEIVDTSWKDLPLAQVRTNAAALHNNLVAAMDGLDTITVDNKKIFDSQEGRDYADRLQKLIKLPSRPAAEIKAAAQKLVEWFDNALEELTKGKYYRTLLLLQTK